MILAGLGASLFVVGMWRVDGVMAAMGLSLGVLFVLAWILGRANLRHHSLHYLGPRRVEAGKGFPCKLILVNEGGAMDGFRVGFSISMLGERDLVGKVSWITGKSSAGISERPVLRKRGLEMIHRGRLKSAFPLGLMAFSREIPVAAEIGVLPGAVIPRELYLSGQLLDGSPYGASRHFGGGGEWRGLRERRGGDGLRRIAWAASLRSEAAGGAVLVREDDPPGSQAEGCMVVFHSYGGDGNLIRPDRFEKAISLLYGSLAQLVGWGMPVRWFADFDGWRDNEVKTRRQLAQAREGLMLAERARGTEAHNLIAVLGRAGAHECVVVISDMPSSAWEGFVPATSIPPVLVDIRNYDGSRRKGGRA
ncbi:hypothetical protein HZ994_03765 [Akkermansiaceae bacterium]|nr:hypothetical protein HZ994_03765 [Akkermansiaceae bacterium]